VIHVPVFIHVVLLEFCTGDPPGYTPELLGGETRELADADRPASRE